MDIQLIKRTGKTKKGNEYTAFQFVAGLYRSPLYFPTDLEKEYLERFIAKKARTEFKKGQDGDGSLDDLDD